MGTLGLYTAMRIAFAITILVLLLRIAKKVK